MQRYETAFYHPLLADWTNYGGWEAAGSRDAADRATGIWQQALTEYEEPAMDAATREELDTYVARRKEEIGDNEP